MPNQNNPDVLAAEETEKIERMNRIRQTMANKEDGNAPKQRTKTQMLDVSVADNPPEQLGSDATRAEKLAQIREALSMVERPAAQPQQPAPKKGSLPPLKKKGSKSNLIKNAAAETVVTAPPKKSPPPVQQKTKSGAKPVQKPAPKPVQKPEAPKPVQSAPAEKPVQNSKKPAPLPPLKMAGTKGTAAKNAAADTVVTAMPPKKTADAAPAAKPSAPAKKKKAEVHAVPKKPEQTSAPNSALAKKPAAEKKAAAEPKKKLSVGKLAAIFGGAAGGTLLIVYLAMAFFFHDKFLPNTYVNGVAIGNMTMREAEDVLLSKVKADDLVLTTAQDEQVSFSAKDYSAEYAIPAGGLDAPQSENNFLWIKKLFVNSEYTMEYDFSYSEEGLRTLIVDHDWGSEVSQNAYIQRGADGMYEIVPATTGNQFDKNKLMNFVTEQLTVGRFMVDMEESGCYDAFAAEIQAEDLQEKLEICNKFAQCTITYDFSDRKEVLEGSTIADWVLLSDSSEITFNRSELETFVAGMAEKYDTYGRDRTFRSTLDGTITVPWTSTSMYGWQIDQEKTVNQLYELLEACESATVEPIYTAWGYAYNRDTNDIGSTYIEVDISAQHLWYYKGGVLQMDSDVVTGVDTNPERRTPRGIFEIWSHEKNRVLGQMDDEGYETLVNYWMPVNYTGVGLHDATWQSSFGGSRYLNGHGSHGCINLPLGFAKDLYNSTVNGIPVVIHE